MNTPTSVLPCFLLYKAPTRTSVPGATYHSRSKIAELAPEIASQARRMIRGIVAHRFSPTCLNNHDVSFSDGAALYDPLDCRFGKHADFCWYFLVAAYAISVPHVTHHVTHTGTGQRIAYVSTGHPIGNAKTHATSVPDMLYHARRPPIADFTYAHTPPTYELSPSLA
eukprot:2437743-Rhodomonas_salina.2